MFVNKRCALPIIRLYSSSLSPSSMTRDAQWPFAYIMSIEIRFSTIPGDTREPGFRRRVTLPKEKAEEPRHNSWDRDAKGYTDVGYVWDSDHGLCPAVMTTVVRRFPLGMTIDDRGLRASDFFLVSFFSSSLFSPLSPPVRWERKPDRGSLRPLSDRPAPLRHRECKREKETGDGGWTERTGMNRLNLPTPYRHVLRAMRDF